VAVENAKFQQGYLNSKLLGTGTLLLWDQAAAPEQQLTILPGPDTENNRTVRHAGGRELASMASSGVSVSGSLPGATVSAEAEAEITRQTSVVVREFEALRFHDPDFVLNEEDYADYRVQLGDQHADNDLVRFIFIAGATVADDACISIGTPTDNPNEFKLRIAGKEYRLSYSGVKSVEWSGAREPVFIQPRVYRIARDAAGATGYRFVEDRQIRFNLTEMLNRAEF
jgi:hypothetical protein